MSGIALRILIADDDEGDRKQIKRAIHQSGLECQCAETESTEEALEICNHSDFDCVIVDYQLPGQDGLAGISAIHERFPHLPIVMSTGQGDEMVAADAMKRGASDYIPKNGVNAVSIRRTICGAIEKAALRLRVKQQEEDLENFARLLVHDLRSPILSIMGFAQLIREELADGNPEEAVKCSNWVIQTAQRMYRLIDTLRQYTQADTKVVFTSVDMNGVLDGTLANLDILIRESRAVVTADALPNVKGNAGQLGQLLQNLIENGIKYCDEPTACIQIAAAKTEDNNWRFSVIDNGIGIAEMNLMKIFEPLKRMNGSEKFEGTGLGLATCKRIVERHGGRIWCESTRATGTTFNFTLDAASAAQAGGSELLRTNAAS
jgi:signal transduction histidine kinase